MHTPRRIYANLLIELKLGEGQFDSLPDFLFLDVQAADVLITYIGFLCYPHDLNGGVGLAGKDVHHRMGLFVDGDRGVWLEQFTVQSGQYSNVVRGPRRRTYQSVILVDHLDELTD